MQSVSVPLQARAHRHDLRSLTYIILDEANGGIVRNLTHQGVAVQAVAPLRFGQMVRVRFDLRNPKLRVEARGEVMWSNPSGQCGVRFLDLPPRVVRQINEWIFGDILENLPRDSTILGPIFGKISPIPSFSGEGNSVMPAQGQNLISMDEAVSDFRTEVVAGQDWLSKTISQRSLAWTVDGLVMTAAFLLFSLIFLSIAHELPRWPLSLAIGLGLAVFVPAFYCAFVQIFGKASLGSRLAKLAEMHLEEEEPVLPEENFR